MLIRVLGEPPNTARTPSANSLVAYWAYPAFLQGKILGATSSKGPAAQARAVFGGVAPAPPVLRSRGPTRPGHLNNFLLCNQLTKSRVLRSDLPSRPGNAATGHFPRSTGNRPLKPPDHGASAGGWARRRPSRPKRCGRSVTPRSEIEVSILGMVF